MTIEAGKVVIRIEGKDINLSQLINKLDNEMDKSKATTADYLRVMDKISPTLKRSEQEMIQYTSALARIEALQGRASNSSRILANTISQITPNTIHGANAIANLQSQLNKYDAQVASATQKTSGFLNISSGFGRLASAGFAVAALGGSFAALIDSGNRLEKIDTTVRALAGSQDKYNEVLAIAREQQSLYGGSLEENLDNLSGFIYTANQAGVAVDELANIARRLAIVDPVQGFKGASIALKEFFSGEITSLARRFEIPREHLNSIKELGSETEKLAALDQVLNNMGLTQELLTSQAQTTAVAYDKLNGSFQDMFATIGQGVAEALQPAATWFTALFMVVEEGIGHFTNAGDQMADFEARLLTQTTSLADYNKRIDEWNQLLMESNNLQQTVGTFDRLSESQRNLALQLVASGASALEAMQRIEQLANVNTALQDSYSGIGVRMQESEAEITAFTDAAFRLSVAVGDSGQQAEVWAGQVSTGAITVGEATEAMILAAHVADEWAAKTAFFTAQQEAQTAATEEATVSIFDENAEIESSIVKKGIATVASAELALQEEYLANIAGSVAAGQISIGDAALDMAQKLNIAEGEAYELIAALAQLEFAKLRSAAGVADNVPANVAADIIKSRGGTLAEIEKRNKAREAMIKYNESLLTTQQRLDKLRGSVQFLDKNSEDYWKTLGDIQKAEKELAAEEKKAAKGGGGGGSKAKKSEAQKANEDKLKDEKKLREDLLDVQADFAEKMEDAEQDHLDKVNEIYQDFYDKQRELQQENEIDKRRSRFDFYSDLTDTEGVDTSAFAAQYEAAFAEAQRIAQEGKAALSQEFLELRQKQIEEMMELEQQMAEIRNDEDLSDSEKRSRLAYLEGLKKLLEEAQAEELKQLLEGGDEAVAELDARLTEEEKRYAEQTQKIAEEASKQADEKVLAAQRSREAILLENEALQAQYDLLKDITATGATPNTTPPLPQASNTAPLPVEIQDPTQTGIAPPTAVQGEIVQMHDSVLNSTFLAVGARLEGQLVNIITAIDSTRDAITKSLSNVETGISKLGQGNLLNK